MCNNNYYYSNVSRTWRARVAARDLTLERILLLQFNEFHAMFYCLRFVSVNFLILRTRLSFNNWLMNKFKIYLLGYCLIIG